MEEGNEKLEGKGKVQREEIFSKAIRAGKRTYYFDVKATRRNDYYLTITESKKRFNKDGRHFYEKHKIFLYKEDFDKFADGLTESIAFIKDANPEILPPEDVENPPKDPKNEYTDVDFEDLDKNSENPETKDE
jgi:hypothetical protein